MVVVDQPITNPTQGLVLTFDFDFDFDPDPDPDPELDNSEIQNNNDTMGSELCPFKFFSKLRFL